MASGFRGLKRRRPLSSPLFPSAPPRNAGRRRRHQRPFQPPRKQCCRLLRCRLITAQMFQFFSIRQLSPAAFSELHTRAAASFDVKGPIEAWK
jgi:hypothetical protein